MRSLPRMFFAALLDLVLPRWCPGCGGPGPWCGHCAATIARPPRPIQLPDPALDRIAQQGLPMPTFHALSRYGGPVRAAIVAGKERGRRDLPPLLGAAIGRGVACLLRAGVWPGPLWLVPAPTRPAAARARGGDPVLAMARSAAQHLARHGIPTGVAPCLSIARGARDSVGLDAAARAANLARRIRFRPDAAPDRQGTVILIDDVLTTGATVIGSQRALASAGFATAGVLTVASVPQLRSVTTPAGR